MPGAFDASAKFDYDALATADEIQHRGEETLRWLEAVATSAEPWPVDLKLVNEIHFRWFETTFRADAGRHRTEMVLNRKATAVQVEAILPAVHDACESWNYRARYRPSDEPDLVEFLIVEANTLAVRIYDAHPFIDGNTRTTWHLRNYVLMLDGLQPLADLTDDKSYEEAWWGATAENHDALDEVVLRDLAAQEAGAGRLA